MFIKKTILSLTLLTSTWQYILPVTLTNQVLKNADIAGFFKTGLLEIIRIREDLKHLTNGKYTWHGARVMVQLKNKNTEVIESIEICVKKPEALFGATYVVLNPDHPLIQIPVNNPILQRYKTRDMNSIKTDWVAIHPITQEELPVFISDYRVSQYETRITKAHLAIPAHDSIDFVFAKKHNLAIKLVITSFDKSKASSPRINRNSGLLESAYQGDYSDCLIINSQNFNGPIKVVREKIIQYLTDHAIGSEYNELLKYQINNIAYSVHELATIETTLQTQSYQSLPITQEQLQIALIQAQNDFVVLVEQFLVNAHEARDLMTDLIEESCALRNTPHAYLLKWARMNIQESEIAVFQKDITNFQLLVRFWSELINFLGDFASSCPHTINALKQMKKQ